MRCHIRPGLVGGAVAGLVAVTPIPAAHANVCAASAERFVVVAQGSSDPGEPVGSFWYTETVAPTRITLLTADPATHLWVLDDDCHEVCVGGTQCDVAVTGDVTVGVLGGSGEFVLTALPIGAPGVTPDPSACNTVDIAPLCVGIETGAVVRDVVISPVEPGPVAAHQVTASLDAYEFSLPTGGTVTVPCLDLTVDDNSVSLCAAAGGTFDRRVAVLYDDAVGQPGPLPATPVTAARVCAATVTVTVSGFGVEQVPSYALC